MRKQTVEKFDILMKDLIAAYGDKVLVSRKQIRDVFFKKRDSYPHYVCITKNADYKSARGKFLLTMEKDHKVLSKLRAEAMKADAVKNDAVALTKEVIREIGSKRKRKETAVVKSASKKAKVQKTVVVKKDSKVFTPRNEYISELDNGVDQDLEQFNRFIENE